MYAYARKRLIDYKLGLTLLFATIPLALLGTWAAGWIPSEILKVILRVGLFAVAFSFLRSPENKDIQRMDAAVKEEYGGTKATRVLITSSGENIRYHVCNRSEGMLISGIGGPFVGLISTGLGELNGYFLLRRCRVPFKISVATSMLVVAVTALGASAGHFVRSCARALGVPSGLDATTGQAAGYVVHANVVLTFALPRTGLERIDPRIVLADIGIPSELYRELGLVADAIFRTGDRLPLLYGPGR